MLKPFIFGIFISVAAQKYGNNLPIVVPTGPDAQFPDLITADNFPLFPFTDQFNTGVELNLGNKMSIAGDLNIPVPGWGNWDMDMNLYTGNINADAKVGYQVNPTNHLNIKPETLALLHQNPAFRKARKKAKVLSIGRFPYGYEPLRCKPPYCNPFVHHTAVGVEFEEGDDSFLIGGIDFPLPVGTAGAGVRFPLSGAVEQGTSPLAYAHGHAFNPSSPFDFTKSDGVRRKPIPSALFNSDIISSKTKKPFHPLEKSQNSSLGQKSEHENVKKHKTFMKNDKDFIMETHDDWDVEEEAKNRRAKSEEKKAKNRHAKSEKKNVGEDDPLAASNIKFDIFS
uniref:Uncharacterized protein n=1 Tax=Acrobeloides nanus TaxID=290746 RepID=A0A914DKU7_9BILA